MLGDCFVNYSKFDWFKKVVNFFVVVELHKVFTTNKSCK